MSRPQEGVRKLGEKVLVRVYMLDNASKVLLADDRTTAEDICHAVAEKLDIADAADMAPLFALYDCVDGATLTRYLEPEELVEGAMAAWDQPERHQLVFMIKLYVDDLVQSTDEKIIYMQYIQAVYMIITGQYPCGEDICLQLAAFQVRVTFGFGRYLPGFLSSRICEFVPVSLFDNTQDGPKWEQQVLNHHLALNGALDLHQARLDYLEIVEGWQCYGCSFFPADQEGMRDEAGAPLPARLVVGICAQGLRLFNREPGVSVEERGRVVHRINILDMNKWGFLENEAFYVDQRVSAGHADHRQLFYTRRGQQIAALLTEYAMELLHHREADETGLSRCYTSESREVSDSLLSVSEPRHSYGAVERPRSTSGSRATLKAVPERLPTIEDPADRISAMDGAGGGVLGAGGATVESSLLPFTEATARFDPVPHRRSKKLRKKGGGSRPGSQRLDADELADEAVPGAVSAEIQASMQGRTGPKYMSYEVAHAEGLSDIDAEGVSDDDVDDATDDTEDDIDDARVMRSIASFHALKTDLVGSNRWQLEEAAKIIQANYRGWRVRRDLFDMEHEMLALLEESADGPSETNFHSSEVAVMVGT